MEMHSVSSSRIKKIGWSSSLMRILFPDGSLYEYYDVSYDEYISFSKSPSLGKALAVLEKRHRFAKVN